MSKISPLHNIVAIRVKREWEDVGVKFDGQQLDHLRFADDVALLTPKISQAERMLAVFYCVCGNVELQLNLIKTMFTRNVRVVELVVLKEFANSDSVSFHFGLKKLEEC
ncbi:unnamed protein product [Heligmosomoides polygyrus]|uniref:Reverse transcriptase domain-containing protein n=1 Tax=Heligmosomoides polygyrus TaxID=6339 RepID=A0A3P8D918_HELPZ|nr:unnamed protein product [Heligmosomoides polygyrus]